MGLVNPVEAAGCRSYGRIVGGVGRAVNHAEAGIVGIVLGLVDQDAGVGVDAPRIAHGNGVGPS